MDVDGWMVNTCADGATQPDVQELFPPRFPSVFFVRCRFAPLGQFRRSGIGYLAPKGSVGGELKSFDDGGEAKERGANGKFLEEICDLRMARRLFQLPNSSRAISSGLT